MRILHTAHSYSPEVSGVADVVGQISKRLARKGHDVHVATKTTHNAQAEERLNGVMIHRFNVEGNYVLGINGDVNKYINFVKGHSWDVLVMHCAQTWATDLILPHLDAVGGVKIFIGHGFSEYENTKYQDYYARLAQSLRKVNRIVALSPLLEENIFCRINALPQPTIIQNGVDVEEWISSSVNIREKWKIGDRPWIISVSNHSPVKGHSTFIELLGAIRKTNPSIIGTIIGSHYPAARWRLGRYGVKGGCWYKCRCISFIRPNIELRWNEPRENVVSAIKEANVVVLTSKREASPIVVLESMAAGTPWVSFDVGCIKEHPGGLIIENLDEMNLQVQELINNKELARKLGKLGKQQIWKQHSWDKIVVEHEEIYENELHKLPERHLKQ